MEDILNYLNSIRRDFSGKPLNENEVPKNPITLFESWMEEAIQAHALEPNAMHISTVSSEGRPSSRIVLLRSFYNNGFVFYTNKRSRKGEQLSTNDFASLTFFWVELDRQVRIEGRVSQVPNELSDEYFNSRPRESRIGAWASQQSEKISSRKELEDAYKMYEEKFKDIEIPRPPHWGGYVVNPDRIEFWQGRPSRLHDRIVFEKHQDDWDIFRLNP